MKKTLSLTWLLFGALALVSCTPTETTAQTATVTTETATPVSKAAAQPVRVTTARTGELQVERRVTGSTEARRVSNVAALSSGALLSYAVAEGASVAQGQVVAQLDTTDAEQALANARSQLDQARLGLASSRQSLTENRTALEASVTAALSSLNVAQRELNRTETASPAATASQLDAARDRVTQARAGVAQAQAQLDLNRAGQGAGGSLDVSQAQVSAAETAVAQAESRLARARVTAPFAGVVSAYLVQPGEFAGQGSPVFRLVDTSSVRATFRVTPQDAAQLPPGTRLNLGYGGTNYVAVIEDGEQIAAEDRQVPLRARIEGGSEIPLGASVNLRYRLNLASGVLVPGQAIGMDNGQNYVYLAGGTVARRQDVTVVAESDGQAVVTGLDDGATVIYPLISSLRDGAAIEVQAQPEGDGQ
ncbi:efflux RND transporter periplasmic adaptor subunit [Deinococcus radiophilus]|uniref:Efflux RND transporter periplasmic adaptor subunit n=1 Tax=Deinococcus radiophilus TaxID=32062 RepID=A0A3S0LAP9_9DEIO|nr:efflux RND transporter periplasmic adaptor subunit [Deinococcus radiophilus]RTR30912.1 efflux RND transporter periplasmic adaptor subunit [Deinococcus radiophilus]UFA49492.1 efflux RND transporter periplasmic adaptor subunit [Deinococcus radiophilus]